MHRDAALVDFFRARYQVYGVYVLVSAFMLATVEERIDQGVCVAYYC
jgi:hypothetical protein